MAGQRRRIAVGSLLRAMLGCSSCLALVPVAQGAIVECRDHRGVLILAPAGGGSACDQRPATSGRADAGVMRSTAPVLATPSAFPRVDTSLQRSRDNDRQRILQDELIVETTRVVRLERDAQQANLKAGVAPSASAPSAAEIAERLARSRSNVLAIQRELSGLR